MKLKEARRHIARARELDPDDGDIANLHIRIHGVEETSAADALNRLDDYRAALRLDPENAALHDSMGDVCLDDLDDPVEAEKALPRGPAHRARQPRLSAGSVPGGGEAQPRLSAVQPAVAHLHLAGPRGPGNRDPAMADLVPVDRHQGGHGVFFLWLLLATVLFWPGGKVYEWLLVSEIKRGLSRVECRAAGLALVPSLAGLGALCPVPRGEPGCSGGRYSPRWRPAGRWLRLCRLRDGASLRVRVVAWGLRKHHRLLRQTKGRAPETPPPCPPGGEWWGGDTQYVSSAVTGNPSAASAITSRPLRKANSMKKIAPTMCPAEFLHQPQRRRRGAAGGEQVIDQEDVLSRK
jgi:hypothetical protein